MNVLTLLRRMPACVAGAPADLGGGRSPVAPAPTSARGNGALAAAFLRTAAGSSLAPTAEEVPGDRDVAADVRQTVVFSGVGLERGGRRVLDDVDLVLDQRRIAVFGANGSGKTSLLRLIVGLSTPTTGRVAVDGHDPVSEADRVRARTGYLFQNPGDQIVHPIVAEDLAFGLGLGPDETAAVVEAALAKVGIGRLIDRRIHELSGGERQLVALAGILARDPLTILFDEPTSQLDLGNRNRMARILAALPQQAIVVTHDLDLVHDFDRVLVVAEGCIVCDAPPADAVAFYRRLCA